MKITLEVSAENEETASPWWMIIDPKQNFKTDNQALHNIAAMITGPFFSREEAQTHLSVRKHAFSGNAKVFCASGYYSKQYSLAYEKAEKINKPSDAEVVAAENGS